MSTLTHQAYADIQDRIVSGRLRAGNVVSESILAKELGMSRTPVGEAIRQLAAEGLLEQLPRRGTIVRGFDRHDLTDLFEMREALESYAAAKAALRISSTELAKLQALCDAMRRIADGVRGAGREELTRDELKTFLSADMAFHLLILQASGNRRMQRAVTETRTVSSIFRLRRQKHDLRVIQQAHAQHVGILEALCSAAGEQARARMAEHIASSREQTLAELDRYDERGPAGATLPTDLPPELVDELERIELEQVEAEDTSMPASKK
ncbi:MAG: GntR family transcriptional regulator [Pirellulaceae bacterium]